MAMSRSKQCPAASSGSGPGPVVPVDTYLSKKAPAVEEFLRENEWDDGEKRVTGSVLVFVEEGHWKMMLNDRDANCVCFISASSLTELWDKANSGLEEGTLDWRQNKQKGKR